MLETRVSHRPRPAAARSPNGASDHGWYLVSSHGAVLFWIAANPGCTVRDVVDALCLTPRTVWGLLGDLRRAGMLHVRKEGRRHRYAVNPEASFRHPVLKGYPLRLILGEMLRRNAEAVAQGSQRTWRGTEAG